ncbi:MAG: glutamate ligase domain-containing protein, partial [Acidimicrobiales bacterium]
VLTTDNPRHEDPRAIVAEVLAGVVRTDVLVIEPDRRAAIDLAVSAARPGDVVLVTGKGHEQFQIVGDHALPFEDRAEAWSALERVQGAGS